ncbi:MAG TPA: hypothetical protein VFF28_05330 [Candidatus Nanoarchaeia archaeon]|nr:hypothetical protein [Candidatus Nanoarchaeia archaeon]
MPNKKIIYGVIIIAILAASIYGFSYYRNMPGKFNDFAKCLTANNATMYGTEWCKFCKAQKQMFGKSFEYIDFVDCDRYRQECLSAGANAYPAWKINDEPYSGLQQLERLSALTGCKIEAQT